MTSKGRVKTINGQPSKHRGRSVKFYDPSKKRGPVANTSHIPWMVWPTVTEKEIGLTPTLSLTPRFV